MAEALAKRLRPNWTIKSVGTRITSVEPSPDAVAAMQMVDVDIKGHRATSAGDIDLTAFRFVVFLCKHAKREFLARHLIEPNRIRDLFVEDPFGDEFIQYILCRKSLSACLPRLLGDLDANLGSRD